MRTALRGTALDPKETFRDDGRAMKPSSAHGSSRSRSHASNVNEIFRFSREQPSMTDGIGDLDRHLWKKASKSGCGANTSALDSITVETQSLTCSIITGESFTVASEFEHEPNEDNTTVVVDGQSTTRPEKQGIAPSTHAYELENIAYLSHGLEDDGSSYLRQDFCSGSNSVSSRKEHDLAETRSVAESVDYDLKMAIIRTEDARVNAKHAPQRIRSKIKTSEDIVSSIMNSSSARNQLAKRKAEFRIRQTMALIHHENVRRRQKIRSLKDGRTNHAEEYRHKLETNIDDNTRLGERCLKQDSSNNTRGWESFDSCNTFGLDAEMRRCNQVVHYDDDSSATSGYISSEHSASSSSDSDYDTSQGMTEEDYKEERIYLRTALERTQPPLIINTIQKESEETFHPLVRKDISPSSLNSPHRHCIDLFQCIQPQLVHEASKNGANEALNRDATEKRSSSKWSFFRRTRMRPQGQISTSSAEEKDTPRLYDESISLLHSAENYEQNSHLDLNPLHENDVHCWTSLRQEDADPDSSAICGQQDSEEILTSTSAAWI